MIFFDSLNGLAYGSGLYKTTDGGKSWNASPVNGLSSDIYDMIKIGNNSYAGIGANGIYIKTTDNGATWVVSNVGESVDLYSVCTSPDGNIFAGSYEKIYKSTDKGQSWSSRNAGTNMLTSISFPDSNTGYGVGYYGTYVKSSDGGETWNAGVSPATRSWFKIIFVNNKVGYICNGLIVKTTDGGRSWFQVYDTSTQLNDITYIGENLVWAAGTDKVINSTNSGISWSVTNFSEEYITGIYAQSMDLCFVIGSRISGETRLYRSNNGGMLLPLLKYPANNSQNIPLIVELSWTSPNNANSFRIQVSTDSVFNNILMDTVSTNTKKQLNSLMLNTRYYWRVKEKFTSTDGAWSQISSFKTTSGAPVLLLPANNSIDIPLSANLSWKDITMAAQSYELQISFDPDFTSIYYENSNLKENNINIVGLSDSTDYLWRIRVKSNNGIGEWSPVWKFLTIAKTPRLIYPANNMSNIPIEVIFHWSETLETQLYQLQVSEDSLFETAIVFDSTITETSVKIHLNYDKKYFYKVAALNKVGHIHWSNTAVFRTILNPLTNLFPLQVGNKWYYYAGSNKSDNYYAVTKEITEELDNGFRKVLSTYYYNDSTKSGLEYWCETAGKLYIAAKPEIHDYEMVYDSSLKEDTFVEITNTYYYQIEMNLFNQIRHTQKYSYSWWFMSGSLQHIKYTIPQIGLAKTWDRVYRSYNSSEAIDSIYLVGLYRNGELLGDTNTVSVSENDNFAYPEEYCLFQNYPNPFNPTTTIEYFIPSLSFVSLKVYDILGREVITLVNEEKPSGRYQVTFNGSSLSSGVYFCRIEAGGYRDSRKLLFIK